MTSWSTPDLDALARVDETRVAGRRKDGSLRTPTIVWQVVVGNEVFVRSVKGAAGQWYRGVLRHLEGVISWNGQTRPVRFAPDRSRDAAIDAAYLAKYGDGPNTQAIIDPTATATTLRIDPR